MNVIGTALDVIVISITALIVIILWGLIVTMVKDIIEELNNDSG